MLRARNCSELAATDKSRLLSASVSASEEIRGRGWSAASQVNADRSTERLPPTHHSSSIQAASSLTGSGDRLRMDLSGRSLLGGPGEGLVIGVTLACPLNSEGSLATWGPQDTGLLGTPHSEVTSDLYLSLDPHQGHTHCPCMGRIRANPVGEVCSF